MNVSVEVVVNGSQPVTGGKLTERRREVKLKGRKNVESFCKLDMGGKY